MKAAWRVHAGTLVCALVLAMGAAGFVAAPSLQARDAATPPTSEPTSAPAATAPTKRASREPLDLVPVESLLCWYGRPRAEQLAVALDSASPLGTILDVFTRLAGAGVTAEGRLMMRAFESFGLWTRYPHALVLVDTEARAANPGGASKQVDKLRAALIVQAGGETEPLLRFIQKVVSEQTDAKSATLTRKRAGEWSYQELRDSRLPEWAAVSWGSIGEQFVFCVGDGLWEHIARVARGEADSLARESWTARARKRRGNDVVVEIFVAGERIRERLDPLVDGRATAFFREWSGEDLDRAYFGSGFKRRAMYCIASFLRDGKTEEKTYADADLADPRILAAIPETTRYVVYDVPAAELISRTAASLAATRGAKVHAALSEWWARFQQTNKFDFAQDVLKHLGERVIVHNDPPHPLRFPLAVTSLIEIRGEPERVRNGMHALFEGWVTHLAQQAEEKGLANPNALLRDGDGVWYLQLGPLAGPACIVTDRYIISSWSPAALREYLDRAGESVGWKRK